MTVGTRARGGGTGDDLRTIRPSNNSGLGVGVGVGVGVDIGVGSGSGGGSSAPIRCRADITVAEDTITENVTNASSDGGTAAGSTAGTVNGTDDAGIGDSVGSRDVPVKRKRIPTDFYGSGGGASGGSCKTDNHSAPAPSHAPPSTSASSPGRAVRMVKPGTAIRASDGADDSAAPFTSTSEDGNDGRGDSKDSKRRKNRVKKGSRLSLSKRRVASYPSGDTTPTAAANSNDESDVVSDGKDKLGDDMQQQQQPQKYIVGTVISKDFDGVAYRGEIISYDTDERYYRVRYVEDGDEEELDEAEISKYLLPHDADAKAAATATASDDTKGSTGAESSHAKTVLNSNGGSKDDLRQKTAAADASGDEKVEQKVEATTMLAKKSKTKSTSGEAKKEKTTTKKKKSTNVKTSGTDYATKEGRRRRRSDGESSQNNRTKSVTKQSLAGVANAISSTVADVCKEDAKEKSRKAKLKTGEALYPIGTGVAKDFGGIVYRGEVISYNKWSKFWKIRYEDSDEEDLNLVEMNRYVLANQEGARLAGTKREQEEKSTSTTASVKPPKIASPTNENTKAKREPKSAKPSIVKSALDELEADLAAAADLAKSTNAKSNVNCITSLFSKSDKETRIDEYYPGYVCRDIQFYCSLNDETPRMIADRLGCKCKDLLADNRARYKGLTTSSKLQEGTILQIPERNNIEKLLALYRYEEGEDKLDFCCECFVVEDPNGPPILLCDGCDAACHLTCTHDKLSAVPDDEWYCRKCCSKRNAVDTPAAATALTSTKATRKVKARSKLKLVPKSSRVSATKASASSPKSSSIGPKKTFSAVKRKRQSLLSSATPSLSPARLVTPATGVLDSLAFIGGSSVVRAAAPNQSKVTSGKSSRRSNKRQPKSSSTRKSIKKESILSSPEHALRSKHFLAALDGQDLPEEIDDQKKDAPDKKQKIQAAKKKKKSVTAKHSTSTIHTSDTASNLQNITQSVEEEFRQFELTRTRSQKQTICLRIRRLKEELQTISNNALNDDGDNASEATIARSKKIVWKQLEVKNLEDEEKRLSLRLQQLSTPTDARVRSAAGDGENTSKPVRPKKAKEIVEKKNNGRPQKGAIVEEKDAIAETAPSVKTKKRVRKPSGSMSEMKDKGPKTKKRKKSMEPKKSSSGKVTKKSKLVPMSEPQKKRNKAVKKRKQLAKKARRRSKTSVDDDSDEDYEQVWVDSNAADDNLDLYKGTFKTNPMRKKRKDAGRPRGGKKRNNGLCIPYYRWMPCGSCIGCQQKVDCGRCRSCLDRPADIDEKTEIDRFHRYVCIYRQCLKPVTSQPIGAENMEQSLPALPGGVKPQKQMPVLGGVKRDPPADAVKIQKKDGDLANPSTPDETAEIQSLSDNGAAMFEISDMEEEEEDSAVSAKLPMNGVGMRHYSAQDMPSLPPVPPQVTVPSPIKAQPPAAGPVGNAAQLARDLRRMDRSTYDAHEDDDEDDSEMSSLCSGDELMALPPL